MGGAELVQCTMELVLVLFVCLSSIVCSHGQDIVWYIDPRSTEPVETCGHESSRPCPSVTVVFERSLLVNESGLCYKSLGDLDGRSSTTVYITGYALVPAVCLHNWHNLHVASYPPGSSAVINTNSLGVGGILFSFYNSTNVTLEGLVFNTSNQNTQNLYFEDCTHLTIKGCSMPLSSANGYGVQITDSGGQLIVEDSFFSGDPSIEPQDNHGIALRIVSGTLYVDNTIYPQMDIVIRNCSFQNLISDGKPQDDYGQARSSALSLLVQFRRGTSYNTLSVEDSIFQNISNTVGHSVTVHFASGSFNNTVSFSHCTFQGNRVRYGGGIATYFSGGEDRRNSSLRISDCNFINNHADFEGGGVFVAFLEQIISNKVFIESCSFHGNRALYGAAMFLFNNPAWFSRHGPPDSVALPITPVNVSSCDFSNNEATLDEGIVTVLRILLTLDNVKFTGNKGSAVLLRLSLTYLEGELLFENNTATLGAALNVQDRSRVDMRGASSALFKSNMAVEGGGAIYGDESSTSFSYNEYNHSLAANRFGFCFVIFGNEGQPIGESQLDLRRITFEDNTAIDEGGAMRAYSLRGCQIANFVPKNLSHFLPVFSDNTTVFEDARSLGTTTTGPSYLFFYGASTRCYKPVGSVTYLLPNCSHNLINQTFSSHPGLSCSLNAQLKELDFVYGPGAALRPTVDKMITPWAGVESSWTLSPDSKRIQCGIDGEEEVPGQIDLSPAPGEEFDITVQLADQLLNYVSATIYIDIEHESLTTPPGVLLQLNGIQYSFTDRVSFTPNRALSGLALVGLPGTEGQLRVVVDSQVRGRDIVLLIPFKLAQCPLGYYPPPGANTLSQVNNLLLSTYIHTQRIPEDQPLACSCLVVTGQQNTTLIGLSSEALSFTHACIRGYTVQLSGILWAGLVPRGDSASLYPPTISCPIIPADSKPVTNSLTEFILEARSNTTIDPVDVVTYEPGVHPGGLAPVRCFNASIPELVLYTPDGEFSLEFCSRGYCQGDQLSSWFVSDENQPCIPEREGVLCGQCRSGYAVTTYSTMCKDCHGAITAIPVLLTLILGLMFVIAVVALNFEASPTIDSLLFFTQAVYILLAGRTNYGAFTYLAFFNPDFTFNLCWTNNLKSLGRLGLQYVTPLYILSLLLLLLLLTKIKIRWMSRLLGRHSFLKSLWFLVLVSYLNIALATFELLHCRKIGPSRQLVLDYDASVSCYSGAHLAAAAFAIIFATFVVLPFPIFTIVLLRFPRFKPFTDAYTFMYRDWRRWWVAWSLIRRLLLVLIGVFVTDFIYRHFFLLLGLLVILLVDVLTWPYCRYYDNFFSIFISWILLIVGLVTEPGLYLYVDPRRGVSGFLVVGGVVSGVVLAVVERILWKRRESVDSVVGRLVRRWRQWWREGEWPRKRKPVEDDNLTIQTLDPSPSQPRYRESLLGDYPLEDHPLEDQVRKGWWKKKKDVKSSENFTARNSNSSSVFSTSVHVDDDPDCGIASVKYKTQNTN